jgi:hypothetical protein
VHNRREQKGSSGVVQQAGAEYAPEPAIARQGLVTHIMEHEPDASPSLTLHDDAGEPHVYVVKWSDAGSKTGK